MGGLFATPSPAPLPPPPAPVSIEEDTAKERKELLERQRRGRSSTIATSHRGVLRPSQGVAVRKSLLGE